MTTHAVRPWKHTAYVGVTGDTHWHRPLSNLKRARAANAPGRELLRGPGCAVARRLGWRLGPEGVALRLRRSLARDSEARDSEARDSALELGPSPEASRALAACSLASGFSASAKPWKRTNHAACQ